MTLTASQQQMVADNLGLIQFTMAKRCGILPSHHLFDDLWQDGAAGLTRSVQTFDPAKGFKFSTYACWWIRQHVQRGIATYEGANFRAARYHGNEYLPPMSLDAPAKEAAQFGDLIPDRCCVEDEALALLIDDVRACAQDDLDHAVIDAALELPHETGSARDKAVGVVFGVAPESVRRRKRAMAARYRAAA